MFYSSWIPALLATRINAAKILSEEYHEKGGTVILVSHDPVTLTYSNLNIKIEGGRIL